MYKLICFDLDDTLWPCWPTIERTENILYHWLSVHKPKITETYNNEQLRLKRKQMLRMKPELSCDLSAARRMHLKQLSVEFDYDDDWIDTAFNVYYQARQQVNLFDDVIKVLSTLKLNYTLAALTNGNAHISHTGLVEFFDFQVSAADVKAAKPDPAMFISAMNQAGVTAEHTLHVGDHPLHDIQGAKNAGVDAVWIRRFGQIWDLNGPEPSLQFPNLTLFNDWLSQQAND
ncbi:hypothetical protein MNBD_GAMMA07-839 [hydrothermal vent metagenome]|uniref:HAD family hydrolase n=1 Tax=hydrothermal vent metagenome TaxID=652676 RepID=A0A3B0WK70_9ZZZZ